MGLIDIIESFKGGGRRSKSRRRKRKAKKAPKQSRVRRRSSSSSSMGSASKGYWLGKFDGRGRKIIHGGGPSCQMYWGPCVRAGFGVGGTLAAGAAGAAVGAGVGAAAASGSSGAAGSASSGNKWGTGSVNKVQGQGNLLQTGSLKSKKGDSYGFKYKYNRSANYPVKKPMSSGGIIVGTSIIGFLVLLWTVAAIISGFHSWKEFPANPVWLKLIRLYVAVLFAPIYLFYIFIRTTVFNLKVN